LGEAVTTAVHILNRASTLTLDGKTPFEAWHGEKPPVHYFKTFECIGHVKNTRPGLQKLEDRSCPMIFIGYEHSSKAYRFYNPDTERAVVSRDAVFDEGSAWKWPEPHGGDIDPQDSNAGVLKIYEPGRKLLAPVKRSSSRLYLLELKIDQPVCLSARSKETAWRWHTRFSHISFQSLRHLSNHDMVHGLPPLEQVEQLRRLPDRQAPAHSIPEQAQRRASSILDLVHGHLYGPITPMTPSGNRFFLLLVDDHSRFMWLMLLPSKNHAASAIKNFQAGIEVETRCKLKMLRTDRGGGNSHWSSLADIVQSTAFTDSSLPPTPRSRTGWLSVGTSASCPWLGACSRPRICQDIFGEKPSPPQFTS
jgi:hypothetical protein